MGMLRARLRPHLVNIDLLWHSMFFVVLPLGVPCSQFQETQHIHPVDLLHPPAVPEQQIVRGIDVLRQRQTRAFGYSAAGFVGNSASTEVVCVCTAMIAVEMSCIILSAG